MSLRTSIRHTLCIYVFVQWAYHDVSVHDKRNIHFQTLRELVTLKLNYTNNNYSLKRSTNHGT